MHKNIKLLDFKLKKNMGADIFGLYKSKFHGVGTEFAEHREYIPGDSIKFIDWKASAKTNRLQIKKYEEERNINVLFIIDMNESFYQFKNKLKLLKETFYTLALSAINHNDNISVIINQKGFKQTPYSYQVGNIVKILEILENPIDKFENIENILQKLNKRIENNLVFILSDKSKLENEKIWKLLGIKNEVIFINIFDYFENNLENIDLNISLENKGVYEINLNNKKKIEKYKKIRKFKLENFVKQLKQNHISYLYLDNLLNPYKEIYKFFLNYE